MKLKSIMATLLMFESLGVLVVCTAEAVDQEFSFDHAFRQFEDFMESRQQDQVALEARADPIGLFLEPIDRIDRMGVAAVGGAPEEGAEEEVNEGLGNIDSFLRKLGDLEDQHAVEAKELSQFSSGWPKNLPTKLHKTATRRKPAAPRRNVPKLNTIDRDDVDTRANTYINEKEKVEVTTEKMARKNDDEHELVFDPIDNNKNKKISHKSLPGLARMDLSHFPKEHRRQSSGERGGFQGMMNKARSVIMGNTNTVLESGNVGTYLTTMWISNLMQTVGFSALGMMASSASAGRKNGYRAASRSRARAINFSEEEELEQEETGFDVKYMTSMLRRIADLADTLHDEL